MFASVRRYGKYVESCWYLWKTGKWMIVNGMKVGERKRSQDTLYGY